MKSPSMRDLLNRRSQIDLKIERFQRDVAQMDAILFGALAKLIGATTGNETKRRTEDHMHAPLRRLIRRTRP